MDIVTFRDRDYPDFITKGNHAQFILPVAKYVIGDRNLGVDIGCKFVDWSFPGSIPVDTGIDDPYHALHLPKHGSLNYIFSSHCLEHIEDWERVLEYWHDSLAKNGVLFLYLPHTDCEYWDVNFMPTKRHVNNLNPEIVSYVMSRVGFKNVFKSERDAAYSFCVYGEKA